MKNFISLALVVVLMFGAAAWGVGGIHNLAEAAGIVSKPVPRYVCSDAQRIQVLIAASECSDRAVNSYDPNRGENVTEWSNRTVRNCIADAIPLVCSNARH